MNNITMGSYYPSESVIHKLDPRIKILASIAMMVLVFLIKDFIGYGIMAFFLTVILIITKIPVKMFIKSLKPMLFLLIFTFILNIFFVNGENIVFKLGFIKIYKEGIEFSLFMAFRLIFMVLSASFLTFTTTPVMLSSGMEHIFRPLKVVKFPVHEMAMMMTISLRFIPTLIEEMDKIKKAQMSRGADFETGGLKQKAMALIPLLVPLFISAFRRADDLAMAMEARCYHGEEGRTSYRKLKLQSIDYIGILTLCCFSVIIILFG